jgi:glycosyltransferase involved in cell wall biosynthesis
MSSIIISNYDDLQNPFYRGGGAVVVHEIARKLTKNHQVTVLTGAYPGAKNETIDGVIYKRIGYPGGPVFSQISFQLQLPYHVLHEQFDIWIESFTPPFSTAFLQLFTHKPVIGWAQILTADMKEEQYRLPFGSIEKLGLKTYKHFVVPMEHTATTIKTMNQTASVEIIPNGVTRVDFSPLPPSEPYIFFIGRLEIHQKGLDMLIKAYALIKDKIKQKLYIAGSGRKKDEYKLQDLIHKSGLADKIILKGRVSGKDKDALFAGADFIAIPSRFEGMSLTALEAFSFKKAVVCFDIPGFSWLDNPTQVLKAKPFDIHDYAQLLFVLAENQNKRDALGERCYQLTAEYTWESAAGKFENLLKNL